MAALSVLGCSQHRVLLVRIFLFLAALHYTSSALTADEYSVIASPSNSVSVILFKSLTLKRARRSVDNTNNTIISSTAQSLSKNVSSLQTTKSSVIKLSTDSPQSPVITSKPTPAETPKPTPTSTPKSVSISSATSSLSLSTATSLSSTIATNKVTGISTQQSTHHVMTNAPSTSPTPTPTFTTPGLTTPLTKIIEDNHKYYKSLIIQNELNAHWINMDKGLYRNHKVLSNNHRLAAPVKINFKFRFFGHTVVNLTIATGGFLYMSPFLHKWLTATQYIAPLMANFDTTIGKGSEIRIFDTENLFVVHWKNVHLHDQSIQQKNDSFNFQVILMKNGTVKFVYKKLPILPSFISSNNHPVKIGLSDAYYIDKKEENGIVRIIYEYHRVTIDKTKIRPKTVVILSPLPTCNLAEDCLTCFSQKNNFTCDWCPAVSRCSNGIDWHRQSWIENKCKIPTSEQVMKCPIKSFPVAAIIIVVIVIILCIALGIWCYHGYSHPTSPLGIWLMENRPSQVKAKMANMKFWKQSTPAGDKYRIESNA